MNWKTLLLPLALLALPACKDKGGDDSGGADDTGGETGETGETGQSDEIAIAGSYTDSWGGTHEITSETWTQGSSVFHISQYDNAGMVAIAQNDAANEWNPELWSRFDWTWDDAGGLWFCQTAYAAASEEEALATAAADATDPATTGCGGFSWTGLLAE